SLLRLYLNCVANNLKNVYLFFKECWLYSKQKSININTNIK
ncbi:unnamed protein product, partial [marine sediment metagenome]